MTDTDPRCAKCGHKRSQHNYRHPFVGPSTQATIDAQAATIEEQAERIEELEAACEVVSNEFGGELWQACRRLLQKTHFDFSGGFPDGIQADNFESHMNETLVEFDRACSQLETKDATIKALVEALERIDDLTGHNMAMSARDEQCVNREARAALAAAKETT